MSATDVCLHPLATPDDVDLFDLTTCAPPVPTVVRYAEMPGHVNAQHLAWLTNTVRRRRDEDDLLLLGGLDG